MNKKGFSTVEFIVSFGLVSIMIVLLFQLILSIRSLYISSGVKTELLTKQSIISRKINEDFMNLNINNLANCGNNCIDITYDAGITKRLEIKTDEGVISYGYFSTEIIENSKIEVPNIIYSNDTPSRSFFIIEIPISHKLYEDENFGISAIYQYNNYDTPLPVIGIR